MLDEANLALNFIELSFGDLFGSLKYDQYAPPLFSVLEKGMITLFGYSELALRIWPLIASILSILLFYKTCKKVILDDFLWFPVGLFAFGEVLLRYSTEAKQYGTDVLMTLIVVYLALHWKPENIKWKHIGFWMMIGGAGIWFSMPSVFVLAGVGLYYLFSFYKIRNWNLFLGMILSSGIWLISFAAYYFFILKTSIGQDTLQQFHEAYFFKFNSLALEDWYDNWKLLTGFYDKTLGHTFLAILWGIITTGWAFYYLFKNDIKLLLLLFAPVLACCFASALGQYSLLVRLILFFIPLLLILIGLGTELFSNYMKRPIRKVMWVFPLVILLSFGEWSYFVKPLQVSEVKKVLEKANDDPGTPFIFVHHTARGQGSYYNRMDTPMNFSNIYISSWEDRPEVIIPMRTNRQLEFWFIGGRINEGEIQQLKKEIGSFSIIKEEIYEKGAFAFKGVLQL